MNKPTNEELIALMSTNPIGYYCGRRLECEFSLTEPTSFYCPSTDQICVSVPLVKSAMDELWALEHTMTDEEFSAMFNMVLRRTFYHEVSHAILTPKKMEMNDIINIFEDSRIETILNNYYMALDFKKTLELYHPFNPLNENCAESFFYDLVRNDKTMLEQFPQFTERVQKLKEKRDALIRKYALLKQ